MNLSEFQIKFSDEALEEIRYIFNWYLERSEQAAAEFLIETNSIFIFLSGNATLFPVVHKKFRTCILKKFPYLIIYEVANNTVIILRMIHTSRNPKQRFRKLK